PDQLVDVFLVCSRENAAIKYQGLHLCTGEVLHSMQPFVESGRFLDLPKLGPACLLRQRNSPAPGSREDPFGATLRARVRPSLPSRKLLQNGNSFRKLIYLSLRIAAILTEPSQRFTYVCHIKTPSGYLQKHCRE